VIELDRFRKASKKGIAMLPKHPAADVKLRNLKIKRVYQCSVCHGTGHNRAGHDWIESRHRENDGPPCRSWPKRAWDSDMTLSREESGNVLKGIEQQVKTRSLMAKGPPGTRKNKDKGK
jgi:hypothetical protein